MVISNQINNSVTVVNVLSLTSNSNFHLAIKGILCAPFFFSSYSFSVAIGRWRFVEWLNRMIIDSRAKNTKSKNKSEIIQRSLF